MSNDPNYNYFTIEAFYEFRRFQMQKISALSWLVLILSTAPLPANLPSVSSPNGNIIVQINTDNQLHYTIYFRDKILISPSPIGMTLDDGNVIGSKPKILSQDGRTIKEVWNPAVPRKNRSVPNHFQEQIFTFDGNYDLVVRCYDHAVAWRIVTHFKHCVKVKNELTQFNFIEDHPLYATVDDKASKNDFITSQERPYQYQKFSQIDPSKLIYPPVAVEIDEGLKVVITESDLADYPGMWFSVCENQSALKTRFPAYVLDEPDYIKGAENLHRADYIADTNGTRCFPWRVIVIAEEDKTLLETEIVDLLASEQVLEDTSWIKPGRVAWDWWNANNLWGVNFEAGINTATYKYYIDFASRYGIEYIVLDEGWSDGKDLFKINPNINLSELIQYGKEKNVGIILWCIGFTLDRQLEKALQAFEEWGVKGVKVDFMNRDDQNMVRYYHRLAEAAARRHLLVDFHSAYKPTGLRRKYPNVITREGVCGLEHNKWSDKPDPEFNVIIPFVRQLAGPMDYTPGAMNNANKEDFRDIFNRPMSMGTRCHQLAMYVIYESPLQMLCDSPTAYENNPHCIEFLAQIPTIWDQTIVLDAKISDSILMARRKGEKWYAAAMTDWTPREITLDLSFLPEGTYEIQMASDGLNAKRMPIDHQHSIDSVTNQSKLKIKLAPGGGWAAIITKK